MPVVGRLDQYASMLANEFDDYSMSENLLTYSEQFNNGVWAKTNVGISTNFFVAPNGSTTAQQVFPTTIGSQLRNINQSYTISTAQSYTFSIFVKNDSLTNNFLAIRISNHISTADIFSNFNFSTETFGTTLSTAGWTGNTSVQKFSNEWYRLSITANTLVGTHTILLPQVWGGGYQGTTDTIGNYLIWGAQFEIGATATEYTPTTVAVKTRALPSTTNINITGFGTYYSSGFSENVGSASTLIANVFRPYDLIYDEFAGTLYGVGQGRYMRQNIDKSVIVYNEIDEITSFS